VRAAARIAWPGLRVRDAPPQETATREAQCRLRVALHVNNILQNMWRDGA
jgi:hypothetical protein